MNKRNIRHGFEHTGIEDDEIISWDVAGPYSMVSAIRQLDPFVRAREIEDRSWEMAGGPPSTIGWGGATG